MSSDAVAVEMRGHNRAFVSGYLYQTRLLEKLSHVSSLVFLLYVSASEPGDRRQALVVPRRENAVDRTGGKQAFSPGFPRSFIGTDGPFRPLEQAVYD